jgi:hypothetical protein
MLHLDRAGALGVDNCDAALAAKIETLHLPLSLKRIFQWCWASKSAQIGKYYFKSTSAVFSGEWFERLLDSNMLHIGSALNGDALIVQFSDKECEVGLFDSTTFAGEDDGSPRDFYVRICWSLDELLSRLADNAFLPIDHQSASELAELRKETRS